MTLLIGLHRWLGVGLCAMFCAWFLSGLVMMWAGYPELGEREKLAAMPPLDLGRVDVSPQQAAEVARVTNPTHVRLGILRERPVYLFLMPDATWTAVAADTAERPAPVGRDEAVRVARAFLGDDTSAASVREVAAPDQWTMFRLWAPYLAAHAFMPALRVDVDDTRGSAVYVAAATGDVVQHVTRRERLLGYAAVVHWVAPTWLRMSHSRAWRLLVNVLAALGFAGSLSGLVLGVWRYRWHDRGSASRGSPYRGWLRWHHLLGLGFGVFACTWVGSGFIAMDSLGWTSDVDLSAEQEGMRGGPLTLAGFIRAPRVVGEVCRAKGLRVRELRLQQLAGAPYYECVESASTSMLVSATSLTATEAFDTAAIDRAVRAAHPARRVAEVTRLESYDSFYYPTWEDKTVNGPRRLPVVRVRFAEPHDTLLYVEPHTGVPVSALGPSSRRWRWLFHGLHSVDVPPIYSARPWWHLVVLPPMLGGTALSLVSLAVAVRRVRGRPRAARSSRTL